MSMRNILNILNEGAGDMPKTSNYRTPSDFIGALALVPKEIIVNAMNSGRDLGLFPSQWCSTFGPWDTKTMYPKVLAEALVESDHAESITDIANVYYSKRMMEPGALDVFRNHVINGGDHSLSDMIGNLNSVDMSADEDPQLQLLAKKEPEFWRAAVEAQLSDEDAYKLLSMEK